MDGQKVVTTSFIAESLDGETIPLDIYLPQGYDPNGKPCNLYIFLHGCCGSNHSTNIGEFSTRLTYLIGNNKIAPVIIVFPSAIGADFGNRHLWFNSERNGRYSDLITNDLLTWLDANYNISKTNRAVGGFSMGADGALRMGLHHSDKFVAAISHSSFPSLSYVSNLIPSLIRETGESSPPYTYNPASGSLTTMFYGASSAWSPNNKNPNYHLDFPVDKNGQLIDSVMERLKLNADVNTIIQTKWKVTKKVPLSIYFDIGKTDEFYAVNATLSTELRNLVDAKNFKINYRYLEFNGGHYLTQEKIDSSLIWLDRVFSKSASNYENHFFEREFSVYPNPAKEFVVVEFNGQISDNYLIDLVDAKGVLMKRVELNGKDKNSLKLNLIGCKRGSYLVILRNKSSNRVIVKKLIKL
ncbi:MAG: alpha/beta hydrolase-fold protein [Bacteroidales bacterium]|nr:alpha/beta hydrolase-fold protein [Bacteroidales bacterium]